MRKFKLINALGAEWDLSAKSSWLQSPSGLGLSRIISSIPAGYDWIATEHTLEQQTVSGDIVFGSYQLYTDFIRFCAAAPLTLCYRAEKKWYFRSCELVSIGKTEINFGVHRLLCPVDFLCLSPWFDRVTASKTQMDASAGKVYNYTYPHVYAETSSGSTEINNTAVIPSPCKLHIRGPVENPSWAMTVAGVVVSTGRVSATIPEDHKLVVDASPSSMEISEYTTNNAFVQSLYGQSVSASDKMQENAG